MTAAVRSPIAAVLRAAAPPALLVAAASLATWGVTLGLAVASALPLWAAGLVNVACAYVAYIAMHDAAHGAIDRRRWVNELVGRAVGASILPLVPFPAFCYLHLCHHRRTNDVELDPDRWVSADRWWKIALRCATLDVGYGLFYARRIGSRPVREVVDVSLSMALQLAVPAALWGGGFGQEVVMAWVIPARINVALLAWVFDYLPHRPHTARHAGGSYGATNIRLGHEAWLTPLMLWQNYHLMHHLYPREPFWTAIRLWRENEQKHLGYHPLLVDVWGRRVATIDYERARSNS